MQSMLVSMAPEQTPLPVEFAPSVRIVQDSWPAARTHCTTPESTAAVF